MLDNEKGAEAFPLPFGGWKSPMRRQRAVMVGTVWSTDLAEILMEVYSHMLNDGYSLEDVSRLVQEIPDDRPGD